MLEIGALSPDNFAARQSYIENTPIDLNSRHPHILKQDFMERPLPRIQEERFDLVSCSLVLNFVPLAEERGE
jgi:25S rRNA (adenine2142-N1)-methyltransferase